MDKIEPTRLTYASFADLPPIDEMVLLAQQNEWLMFQVRTTVTVLEDGTRTDPRQPDREHIIREIASRLPTHKVWDSHFMADEAPLPAARKNAVVSTLAGMARFSIRRAATVEAIVAHLDLLLMALKQYREITNANMERLAQQLGVDLSEFSDSTSWHEHEQSGLLRSSGKEDEAAEWAYFFHGIDCQFTNRAGVSVEAHLGFGSACGNDFAVFDDYFFLYFLKTSAAVNPQFRPLLVLFCDWSDNVSVAFTVLEERGFLKYVSVPYGRRRLILDC